MFRMKLIVFAMIFVALFLGNLLAHVTLLYPVGGETFQAGEVINIKWHEAVNHGASDWDLYFSEDGGSTWQTIILNLPKSQLDYDWTVPNTATNSGQVKVVQDNTTVMDYSDASGDFTINTTTEIIDENSLARDFVLYPAYPNPFNPKTTIPYEVSKASKVSLKVYSISGEEIRTLADELKAPGLHTVVWDGTNDHGEEVGSGIYFYTLRTDDFVETKKMIFLQ